LAQTESPRSEQLHQQIEKRDAIIIDLLRRVVALERQLAVTRPDELQKPAPDPSKPVKDTTPVDEEINRALERSLVREGGMVLPKGSIEFEPRFLYSYRGSNALQIEQLNGQETVALQNAKRDTFDVSGIVRMGLPWTSQIDLRLPFIISRQEVATAGTTQSKRWHSGLGDIELGFTKQLLEEKGSLPGLLTAFSWKSNTGNNNIGSGFHALQGALSAVKRQDPLAFFGTVAHSWSLSGRRLGNDVDLGNTLGLRMGTLLATSPETSLRVAFEVNRSGEIKLNRRNIPGSSTNLALFQFGLSTIILRRTLLDVKLDIGLTPDSPDFQFGVSLPVRLYEQLF